MRSSTFNWVDWNADLMRGNLRSVVLQLKQESGQVLLPIEGGIESHKLAPSLRDRGEFTRFDRAISEYSAARLRSSASRHWNHVQETAEIGSRRTVSRCNVNAEDSARSHVHFGSKGIEALWKIESTRLITPIA